MTKTTVVGSDRGWEQEERKKRGKKRKEEERRGKKKITQRHRVRGGSQRRGTVTQRAQR